MHNKDVQKVTIKTRYDHYEFLVGSFALANAPVPSLFLDLMNWVFCKYLDWFMIVFIDQTQEMQVLAKEGVIPQTHGIEGGNLSWSKQDWGSVQLGDAN